MAHDQKEEVGGTQDGSITAPADDSDGLGFVEGQGRGSGEHVGIPGSDRTVGVAFLLGGIIAQLIQDAEEKRAEVIECIDWYQRELAKCDRRLQQLRSLSKGTESDAD